MPQVPVRRLDLLLLVACTLCVYMDTRPGGCVDMHMICTYQATQHTVLL